MKWTKINIKLIRDNEEHLRKLRFELGKLSSIISDEETLKTFNEVSIVIRDKLFSRGPKGITVQCSRNKRFLLPFAGTALKSFFGVSTQRDIDNLD